MPYYIRLTYFFIEIISYVLRTGLKRTVLFSTIFLISYNIGYLIKFILTILVDVVIDLNKDPSESTEFQVPIY